MRNPTGQKNTAYQARKAAGKCVILECPRMAVSGVKCPRHRLSAKKSAEKARRAKGIKPLAEHVAGLYAKRLGTLSPRSREMLRALETSPRCACGLRHAVCDLPSRRRELPTAGLGSWL